MVLSARGSVSVPVEYTLPDRQGKRRQAATLACVPPSPGPGLNGHGGAGMVWLIILAAS